MTLWLDRTGVIPPGTPATHALVVGVSRYRYLPRPGEFPSKDPMKFGLVGATTPATGAFRFARWLRHQFRPPAPLATVRMLLSPSDLELQDDDLAATAAQVEPACTQNVRTGLLEWQAACQGQPDGMAVLYLSGHGAPRSKTDHFVLLEDFAADQVVMNYSIDVGKVHRGMASPSLPQTQFFFVDACRIRPDAFNIYRGMGGGLELLEQWDGEDERSAPIYFSASPGTVALGEPGDGTLFSQALMHSLNGTAVDDYPDAHGRFHISGSSLQVALEQRVAKLAAAYGERQRVTVGGQVQNSIFHYFPRPPSLPVAIELRPEEARPVAWADLWDADRADRVFKNRQFTRNPMVWMVPAGMYSLDVTIRPDRPPLRSKPGLPVAVAPRIVGPRVVHVV